MRIKPKYEIEPKGYELVKANPEREFWSSLVAMKRNK